MQIIAATSNQKKIPPAKIWLFIISVVCIVIGIIGTVLYREYLFAFFFLAGALLMVMAEIMFKQSFFMAFVEHQVLNFQFEDNRSENNEMVLLQIPLSAISSYRLHSFMKKQPELLQIKFTVADRIIETRTIPIYYLSKTQQLHLIAFLDQLLVKIKRLH